MEGKKKRKAEMREVLVALPARQYLLGSAQPPSLCAGVKYRKLLLYNSASHGTFFFFFFFFLSQSVCVDDFKLELFFFFMAM